MFDQSYALCRFLIDHYDSLMIRKMAFFWVIYNRCRRPFSQSTSNFKSDNSQEEKHSNHNSQNRIRNQIKKQLSLSFLYLTVISEISNLIINKNKNTRNTIRKTDPFAFAD